MPATHAAETVVSTATDREIVTTRIFDAPRELVFMAWTEPRHLIHWWGPTGFTNTFHEISVRPGGIWRFVMHGPDGRDYANKIVFEEVVKPERLVFSHPGDEGERAEFRTTVTFEDYAGKTHLTMRMLFPTTEERDRIIREYGALEGAKQTFERLAEELAKIANPDTEVVLRRTFNAPRELVFRVWIESEHVAQWWGPGGFTNPRCEVDARVGGSIRIDMRGPDGTVYPMDGIFREIVPPERLVFVTRPLDDKGNPLFEVLNTVTFADQNGKTELTLTASVLNATAQAAPFLRGMEMGWTQSLQRLAAHVETV